MGNLVRINSVKVNLPNIFKIFRPSGADTSSARVVRSYRSPWWKSVVFRPITAASRLITRRKFDYIQGGRNLWVKSVREKVAARQSDDASEFSDGYMNNCESKTWVLCTGSEFSGKAYKEALQMRGESCSGTEALRVCVVWATNVKQHPRNTLLSRRTTLMDANSTTELVPNLTMSEIIVSVKQGALRGIAVKSAIGGTFLSFKGIPYAAAPVGNLRFKVPEPPIPWEGIRDATKEGPKCAQIDMITGKFEGQDDCLYLNIATTSLTGSRAVMVWIHGGSFVTGHGGDDLYGPDFLVAKEIVFVSINYRLGPFGFLNLESTEVSGNMGLKDQSMALRWVKENIAAFGGDPNNVTIFGESAGGVSASLHAFSPLSKGLFHKIIAQSGSAANWWSVQRKNYSYQLLSILGMDTNDPKEALEFIRDIPCEKIVDANRRLCCVGTKIGVWKFMGPNMETAGSAPFLPAHPQELIRNGAGVPFMFGVTDAEGIIGLTDWVGCGVPDLNDEFVKDAIDELTAENPSAAPAVHAELRKLYLGEGPITNEDLDKYVQMLGDVSITIDIYELAQIQAQKKTPAYFYKLSFRGKSNVARRVFNIDLNGTMHFEDVGYLFYSSEYPDLLPAEGTMERRVTDQFVTMWTNFAKTGDPTPETDDLITTRWLPLSDGVVNYLEIGERLETKADSHVHLTEALKRIRDLIQDR